MFIKKKKIFNYQNQIILINGSTLKINSIKYLKNYELNNKIFKKLNKIEEEKIIQEIIFLKKIQKK